MALPIRSHWLGTAPGGLLWFALWDCDQAFVLRLTHLLGHTHTHTHRLALQWPRQLDIPKDLMMRLWNGEWKGWGWPKTPRLRTQIVIITVITKEAVVKRAHVTTVQLLWLIKESRLISATALLGSGLFRRVRSTKSTNIIYLQTTHSEGQRPARC